MEKALRDHGASFNLLSSFLYNLLNFGELKK